LEEDQLRLTMQSVRDLDTAAVSAPTVTKIWVDEVAPLSSLKLIIDREAKGQNGNGGNDQISLMIPTASQEVEVRLDGAYLCTPQVRAAIRAIPGVFEVQEA
jgi:DNA polymerase-3 subunit alpha